MPVNLIRLVSQFLQYIVAVTFAHLKIMSARPQKRGHAEAMAESTEKPTSPFMPMFESFRAELDEHHDRRERVIKASRDITAASKKIIFALQRIREVNKSIQPSVAKTYAQHETTIRTQYAEISKDLQDLNAWRYQRQISGGNQEFLEALTFQHYLETSFLISYQDSQKRLTDLGGETPIMLPPDDYLLGVFDMVGELMRFSITTMATTGTLPSSSPGQSSSDAMELDQGLNTDRTVLSDMRDVRSSLEGIEVDEGPLSRDVDKKMTVMKQCVEKVENAAYSLIIRGRERPKGWVPDADPAVRQEVESF